MNFDVVIHGGLVVDGTGAPPWRADVGITGGAVSAFGQLAEVSAGEVVDAAGRLVMPGFVDAHSHADVRVLDDDVQLALLRQGVTTVVTGQDGVSFAPGGAAAVQWAGEYFAGINGPAEVSWRDGLSLAEYRAGLDGRARVNTAHLLPHGTLRYDVAGLQPELDGDQLRGLVRRVEDGLGEGAVGLSTGLHYVPGLYGDVDEFTLIGGALAAAGRPCVTHMRGYEADAWIGMGEVHTIATRSGAAVHVSHFHGPSNMLVDLVDQAREDGVDLTFDSYPYLRGFTLLTVPLLPADLLALPPRVLVDQLGDAGVVSRLLTDWFPKVGDVFDRAVIAGAPAVEFTDVEGLSVTEAAAKAGMGPGEFAIALLRATGAAATAVFCQPPTNTDADVRALLRHEAHMGGSDGIFLGGHPHPRAWGTFARYLALHTRDLGDWTWGEASLHLAGHPARRFGLARRGVLRPGAAADVVLVDPGLVQDTATYPDPARLAVGIDEVWVNGQRVLHSGELTPQLAGRALSWGD
ncbi:N-acyl-D-amino-acid deacylase family protein [Phytoactinopolyspora limicola]|uniref:N-acyl-D-amino-acid deacylase family protein n=1 Tax=Phytoactinopolyspora limicola TaxID=2715536 RepID=UPI00140C46F5|nr:amidohydrolase family protein [Phytoactinopolyspora limicola]